MAYICSGNNCAHCNGEAVPMTPPPFYTSTPYDFCSCYEDNFSPCPSCRRKGRVDTFLELIKEREKSPLDN